MPDNAPIRFTATLYPSFPRRRESRLFPCGTVEEKRVPHPGIPDSRLRGDDDNLSCLSCRNALNTTPLTLMVFGSNAQHPITNGKGMVRNFLESHLPPTNHMPTQ